MPTDMAELGSGNFDQELTLRVLGGEEDVLEQIEAALRRLESGSYGECETCNATIPESRLDAIPYAAQCVRCASEQEEGDEAIMKRRDIVPNNRSDHPRSKS
jgi:DnaK suppressor protein